MKPHDAPPGTKHAAYWSPDIVILDFGGLSINRPKTQRNGLCVEKKNQLNATEWFMALMLNMFRAHLCPSSGARYFVFYYRLWCAMTWLLVVGGQVQAAGYASRLRDVARATSLIPDA